MAGGIMAGGFLVAAPVGVRDRLGRQEVREPSLGETRFALCEESLFRTNQGPANTAFSAFQGTTLISCEAPPL